MPAFIDDGYTESVVIPEKKGIYEQVRLTFRPVTAEGVSEFAQRIDGLTVVEAKKASADLLVKKIVSWDIRNGSEIVPLKAEMLLKLTPQLFEQIWSIVYGQKAGVAEKMSEDAGN